MNREWCAVRGPRGGRNRCTRYGTRAPDQFGLNANLAPRRDHGGTDGTGPLARRDRDDCRAGARQRRTERTGGLRRGDNCIVARNPPAPERYVQHVVERRAKQRAIARRQPVHQRRRSARRQHRVAMWQRPGQNGTRGLSIGGKGRDHEQQLEALSDAQRRRHESRRCPHAQHGAAGGACGTEPPREEILIGPYPHGAQSPVPTDREAPRPLEHHGRGEPAVHGDADAVETGAQIAGAGRYANARGHDSAPLTSARTSATRGAMTGAARNTGATASIVFRPFPVMHSTTSSSAENRPSPASASAAATVTPPAVSVKIPTASASSRIPATNSASETAAAQPPDSRIARLANSPSAGGSLAIAPPILLR